METGEVKRVGIAGRLRLRRAPSTREARVTAYRETAKLVAENRSAANACVDRLVQHPVDAWASLLAEQRDAWTPQMLLRLASAAEEIEEDSPAEALAILDVARHMTALVPPSSFAYDYACLKVAARRAAALADLARFGEALSELRHARRFVSLGLSNELERAELLVERAYVYIRMGRFQHVLRALHLAAGLSESSNDHASHDRALRVLSHAMSLLPHEELPNVMQTDTGIDAGSLTAAYDVKPLGLEGQRGSHEI